jgi:hypothetical protein
MIQAALAWERDSTTDWKAAISLQRQAMNCEFFALARRRHANAAGNVGCNLLR